MSLQKRGYMSEKYQPIVAVSLTYGELWTIQELVRQHDHQRVSWEQNWSREIHKGIVFLSSLAKDKINGAEYTVNLHRDFLWRIENQVSPLSKFGTEPTGISIQLKVMQAFDQLESGSIQTESDNLAIFNEAIDSAGELGKETLI